MGKTFTKFGPKESPEIKKLRKRTARITNLAMFERMVLITDHPKEFRALVEPMLRRNLPCCARSWNEPHEKQCPTVLAAAAATAPAPVLIFGADGQPAGGPVLPMDDGVIRLA